MGAFWNRLEACVSVKSLYVSLFILKPPAGFAFGPGRPTLLQIPGVREGEQEWVVERPFTWLAGPELTVACLCGTHYLPSLGLGILI